MDNDNDKNADNGRTQQKWEKKHEEEENEKSE